MLGRCSNPSCSAPFRYLRDGKLFRLETDPKARTSKPSKLEYFWLCDHCSPSMSLRKINVVGIKRCRESKIPAPGESLFQYLAIPAATALLTFVLLPSVLLATPLLRLALILLATFLSAILLSALLAALLLVSFSIFHVDSP